MAAASLDTRRIQAAKTQSFFREINKRVAELSQHWRASHPRFICECLKVECAALVSLTLSEYARVRADPTCFFVLDGHEDDDVEDVLTRSDRYLVVQKLGVGAETAVSLDRTPEGR
jgi:hypothetical protein